MANQEQLAILKQGVDVWNKWREDIENLGETIEFRETNLYQINLNRVNLGGAHLIRADFREAYLIGANFNAAYLREADLKGVDLSHAYLIGADLRGVDFRGANLLGANLTHADLGGANLGGANLSQTDLGKAYTGSVVFGDTDLSETIGLDEIVHEYPSTIGINTLQRSKGKIPVKFLRGCGLSDLDIEYAKLYNPDLGNQEINDILYKIYDLRARQAIQVSPLFISYSHADATFVGRLEDALNDKGIRFWRDIHHATSGRLERQIEQAILHNPTVLLVLSANAVESDWVQYEVRKARGLEKELGRDVLCPVALDDRWKDCGWPERVMEQVLEYNVLDFSKWQDDGVFRQMFDRLLDGLQLFYKG